MLIIMNVLWAYDVMLRMYIRINAGCIIFCVVLICHRQPAMNCWWKVKEDLFKTTKPLSVITDNIHGRCLEWMGTRFYGRIAALHSYTADALYKMLNMYNRYFQLA